MESGLNRRCVQSIYGVCFGHMPHVPEFRIWIPSILLNIGDKMLIQWTFETLIYLEKSLFQTWQDIVLFHLQNFQSIVRCCFWFFHICKYISFDFPNVSLHTHCNNCQQHFIVRSNTIDNKDDFIYVKIIWK